MTALLTILIYGCLIMLASLLGGWLPNVIAFTHKRMQITLSFVGGLMLGIAVLMMLPHAIVQSNSVDGSMMALLAGLLFMFLLIRLFHFHQHSGASDPEDAHTDCDHDQSHHHHHEHGGVHELSWTGVAIGMSLHTIVDGIAMGTAVVADQHHQQSFWGIGVFLAIVLHQPLDALSITSLMKAGGWPTGARTMINLGFSLLCPLAATVAVLGLQTVSQEQNQWIGLMLAFSAGVFLCISLGDLLPEVQFHRHDRLPLSIALLVGIACAYGIVRLEASTPGHSHSHDLPSAAAVDSTE